MNKTNLLIVFIVVIFLSINSILVYFLIGNKLGRFTFEYVATNNHVLIGDTESGKSWLCVTMQAFEEEAQEQESLEASRNLKPQGNIPLSDEEFLAQLDAIESNTTDSSSQEVLKLDYSKGCLEVINPLTN
ncbi:MAG: hypothetical protein EWV52_14055 [Microcystis panniformis Mp_MB_F_20051200_S6D]|nr:MAG: hypothetical protein EWV52_14055 [Microcystis panniformis Mp_MB_F_20051200_S6D]